MQSAKKPACFLFVLFLCVSNRLWAEPVTDATIIDGQTYFCSQSGISVERGDQLHLVYQPDFRSVCLVGYGCTSLLVGGGEPEISGQVGILDLTNGQFNSIQVARDLVYAVDVRDNKAALACADGSVLTLILPDFISNHVIHQHTAAVTVVQFSNNGLWLASGGLDSLVILSSLTVETEPILLQDHTAKVECLTFSPDDDFLASGAQDGKIRIHAVSQQEQPMVKANSVRLIRTYTNLGLEKMASTESTSMMDDNRQNDYASIGAIAWGGMPETLVAGSSRGVLYQFSLTDTQWHRLDISQSHRLIQPNRIYERITAQGSTSIPANAGDASDCIYSLTFHPSGQLYVSQHQVTRVSLSQP